MVSLFHRATTNKPASSIATATIVPSIGYIWIIRVTIYLKPWLYDGNGIVSRWCVVGTEALTAYTNASAGAAYIFYGYGLDIYGWLAATAYHLYGGWRRRTTSLYVIRFFPLWVRYKKPLWISDVSSLLRPCVEFGVQEGWSADGEWTTIPWRGRIIPSV